MTHPLAPRAAAWLSASLLALSAHAQQASPAAGLPDPLKTAEEAAQAQDTIVVTGSRPIAESEAAAFAVQKASPALISVVAADAVGRLPDQNVAQAIGRLPGISVERDQGQARYVNVRGAPKNWTTISIDGINIISPEGRDTRFDSIPSAIAGQIIVRKAVTPDMTGETVGANIDVVTRSAFDYQGFHFQTRGSGGYGFLGGRPELEGTVIASNRWSSGIGELGVVASASYYERRMITDNFETDWELVPQDTRPGGTSRIWARETENKLYRLTRKNYSGTLRLEWKPDANNYLFAQTIYSAFTDDELRDNYIFDFDDQQTQRATVNALAAACPATAATTPPAGTTGYADVCIGNTPFTGTVYGIDINNNILKRRFIQSIFTNTFGGNHEFGDGWKIRWRGNYTRSLDDRSAPAQFNFDSPGFSSAAQRPTVSYDLTDRKNAQVQLFTTVVGANNTLSRGTPVRNIANFALPISRVRSLSANDTTDAYTGRFEISRKFDFGSGDLTVIGGTQYDNRTKEAIENLLDITGAQATSAGIRNTLQQYNFGGDYLGRLPIGYGFTYFDRNTLLSEVNKAFLAGFTRNFNRNNYYKVREEIIAGYASGILNVGKFNVFGGVRIEQTNNRSTAYATVNGVQSLLTVENDNFLVFPNVNINYNLRDDMKLRLSFNTGAARPDYDILRPNVVINDSNLTISGGNPLAKAEYAKGVDAYYEWYLVPRGFISIGGFYKHVDDVLFNITTRAGDAFNTPTVDRSQYLFTTIGNGGSGEIYGMEAAFQMQLDPFIKGTGLPEWMGGFGIQANVTFNQSNSRTPDGRTVKFPGTSDVTYNIIPYYEKYGFSIRAAYQKRSAWIDGLGSLLDTGGDLYWAADDELDVSARYAVSKRFEMFLEGANLLNGEGRRFAGINARTIEYEKFGARVTGGFRLTY